MPRFRRDHWPGATVHLISRFVNREQLMRGVLERATYLKRAAMAFARCDWTPIAYALMSTHLHWLLVAGLAASAEFVKPLHTGFAGWLNRRNRRLGPVFAGRHHTFQSDGSSDARLIAYIHNNPVRAGLVGDAAESTWTSHRAYLGLDPAPEWLAVGQGLERCGLTTEANDRLAFHEYVRSRAHVSKTEFVDEVGLRALRRQARGTLGSAVEISHASERGSRAQVEVVTRIGGLVRAPWEGETQVVLNRVAAVAGVTVEEIRSKSRRRRTVAARRLALQVWRGLGQSQVLMAGAIGIAESSASAHSATAPHDQAHEIIASLRSK